jgi:hypothetical protein
MRVSGCGDSCAGRGTGATATQDPLADRLTRAKPWKSDGMRVKWTALTFGCIMDVFSHQRP